ncbi:MAG: methylmalonyl-CoA carboxyltransferase [Synergistaceae bacterium]|nr:methylmalonyl-CoA carboxyltransferase [Synergistaceae bacterium]MBQ9594420.1 methylmalonyl-CoA carboxyltransferase [Synergistaceae bacterium]MBR0204460.1 methylmalonyl-CoA carboxyltransferase [Synergistaceae bacterium]
MGFRTIEELCSELDEKRKSALTGGGEEAVSKQKSKGKGTARERIAQLLDPGSFVEIDEFVTHRCNNFGLDERKPLGDGVVTGWGTIEGRKVFVYSQDFTVFGGSLGEKHADKICKVMDMAMQMGCPVIGINDSGGARIQEAVDSLNGYGKIFKRNTLASGVVPQFSVIMGPTAGGAVYSPALTDFVFMVDKESIMHITGPEVIKAVTGEEVTSEELGGAVTHNTVTGDAHFCAADEAECFAQVRKVLSYLPLNNLDDAPFKATQDSIDRADLALREIVPVNPNKSYDVHEVLCRVLDDGEFTEVQAGFAKNIVTGYGRIGGRSVGIIANNADVMAGCLDINASDKASRFIRHCDAFNLPIITFVDVPGYLPGLDQEKGGIIRKGAKLLYAYSEASVPLISVVMRKAYGGAYIAMSSKALGADVALAWPQAEIAVMGAEGAASIVFKKEIDGADDPSAKRLEKIDEYREAFANPYRAAERGYVDRVIMPEETRKAIAQALDGIESKRETRPAKKHGVIPH